MSKVSTMIGVVVDGKPEYDRTINGEAFHTITVNFRGTQIRLLYSTIVCTRTFKENTKVKVVGCVMSDTRRRKVPDYYFYCHSIEEVDVDSELTNTINFSSVVTKVGDFKVNSRCEDMLPLKTFDSSPIRTTTLLTLYVKGAFARRLKDKPKGYTIQGSGYLKKYRNGYEVIVTEVTNIDELSPLGN